MNGYFNPFSSCRALYSIQVFFARQKKKHLQGKYTLLHVIALPLQSLVKAVGYPVLLITFSGTLRSVLAPLASLTNRHWVCLKVLFA